MRVSTAFRYQPRHRRRGAVLPIVYVATVGTQSIRMMNATNNRLQSAQ